MSEVIVFGDTESVYVRTVRLALEEKGVAYRLELVDVFAPGGPPAGHLDRHPFGRIPSFEHDGFRLYETAAITRYVDEAFEGPPLQPDSVRERARMSQAIGILDSYAYRTLVWDIYVERVLRARSARGTDEARVAAAVPRAEVCLCALAGLMGEGPYLTGGRLTLADLHAAPMISYFITTPEGEALMEGQPGLLGWWGAMSGRQSMMATPPGG